MFNGCECLTSVTIPSSVTEIGPYAFSGCFSLTSVPIHDSVTSIGEWAFSSCIGLTNVTLGNSVTSIGEGAFMYCRNLTSVIISNSVTEIGPYAFYQCLDLTSVTLGNSVTEIGPYAFRECDALITLYSFNTTPPSVGSYNFTNKQYRTLNVFVPQGAIETYQNTDPWKKFQNLQEMEATGIDDAIVNVHDTKETKRYDAAGREIEGYHKGLNIIKMSDGTTKKVMVK